MKSLRFLEKLLVIFVAFGMIMKFAEMEGGGMFIVFSLVALSIIYFFGSWFYFKGEEVKQTTVLFSLIAGVGFFLSLLFLEITLVQEMAGVTIFVMSSLTAICLIFFFVSWYNFKKKEGEWKTALFSLLVGAGFSLTCIGISFKLMYWPSGELQLLLGIIWCTIVIVLASNRRNRNREDEIKNKYYKRILDRGMIIVLASSILFSIPSSSMIRFEYRQDPKFAQLMADYLNDPENRTKWEAIQMYRMNKVMDDGHPLMIKPK